MGSERQVLFHRTALKHLSDWIQHSPSTAKKVLDLIEAARREPFDGVGQPEPLKHQFQGCSSRRINKQHRLVYQITDDHLIVLSCRWHYVET